MRNIAFIFFLISCFSCNKSSTPAVPGVINRDITGTVYLYNQFGQRVPNGSNVTIIMTGTSPISNANSIAIYPSNDTAVSDSAGQYILYDVNQGMYTITYSKAGYGTYEVPSYSLIGSEASATLPSVTLQQLSTTIVTSFNIASNNNSTSDTIVFSGTIDTASSGAKPRQVIVFIDTLSSVSSTQYSYHASISVPYGTTSFKYNFLPYNQGISSGTTLYFIAYGQTTGPLNTYHNSAGVIIYPDLNPTPFSKDTSIAITVP